MKKLPWRILAGAFAIAVFYLTLGTVVGYLIYSAVQGQTHTDATLFDTWWQILLFVADVIAWVGFFGSVAMDIVTRIANGKDAKEKEAKNEIV